MNDENLVYHGEILAGRICNWCKKFSADTEVLELSGENFYICPICAYGLVERFNSTSAVEHTVDDIFEEE